MDDFFGAARKKAKTDLKEETSTATNKADGESTSKDMGNLSGYKREAPGKDLFCLFGLQNWDFIYYCTYVMHSCILE